MKIFRKIRESIIKNNKTKSYLLYALGEVLLVMIGILLALQVNNLNENRKLKRRIDNTLRTISSDLETDTIFAAGNHLNLVNQYRTNAEEIIRRIDERLKDSDDQ